MNSISVKTATGILAVGVMLSANVDAATVSIAGPVSVTVGAEFQLQIVGDFYGEGFMAGGVTFLWDSAVVRLEAIRHALPLGPDAGCPGPWCPPGTSNSQPLAWSEFLFDLIDPTAGPTLMTILTFTAIGPGLALFSMTDNPALTNGWWGSGFNPIDSPTLVPWSVTINAVPLPAAIWLFAPALAGLLLTRRRETRVAASVQR